MEWTLTTAPSAEPLATDDTPSAKYNAKDHLRVDASDDDDLIAQLIVAVRRHAEQVLSRALITQTWTAYYDAFPAEIELPMPPLQSVTSVKYVDTSGSEQTVSADDYTVDTDREPGRIVPAYGESWPATRDQINAVYVKYVCGYGDLASDVPDDIVAALKLLLGHYYEHREGVIVGTIASELPSSARVLLAPYRIFGCRLDD